MVILIQYFCLACNFCSIYVIPICILLVIFIGRREYTKRQRIVHSYGDDGDEVGEQEINELVRSSLPPESSAPAAPEQRREKTCVCGGTDHLRRSSARCPLNKRPKK